MKRLSYFLYIGLICLTGSCDDSLDRFPKDGLAPENYFNNETELKTYSNQFYWMLPGAGLGYGENSDVAINFALSPEIQGTRIVPNSGGGWDWGGLRNINTLLKYSHRCKNIEIKEQYEGVARFFRTWFYFNKIKRFGDVPWCDKVLESNDPELFKARDSREIVMQNILEDIDFAIEKLPTNKSVDRVTKWTALALKSRLCLFEGTFRKYHGLDGWEFYLQQSVEASSSFIENAPYGVWQGSTKPYRDLFASYNAIDEEVILARDYSRELKVFHDANFHLRGTTSGRPGLNKKIVNSYLMKDGSRFTEKEGWETASYVAEMKDRDPRLTQTIVEPGHIRVKDETNTVLAPDFLASTTGYQIQKWDAGAAGDGWQCSFNDFIVFRAAEVYLNYAEAKAELGTLTQGDLDISIKKIRDRVGMPNMDMAVANANPDPYLSSKETGYPQVTGANKGIILEIRRERTIELIMEGFRYDDIVRWKEGKVFEQEFYGMYFEPFTEGSGENMYRCYDMNGDGVIADRTDYVDICLYTGTKPKVKGIIYYYKIGETFNLEDGIGGRIICHKQTEQKRVWDNAKDYLYPIPVQERMLNKNLTQNPGWKDGLPY